MRDLMLVNALDLFIFINFTPAIYLESHDGRLTPLKRWIHLHTIDIGGDQWGTSGRWTDAGLGYHFLRDSTL